MAHTGPLYARWSGERLQLGFRVEHRHTNPLGICHGGMMASFADMLLPCAAQAETAWPETLKAEFNDVEVGIARTRSAWRELDSFQRQSPIGPRP